jgi:hypothetical protein
MGKWIKSEELIGKQNKGLTILKIIDIPNVKGRKLVCECICGKEIITNYTVFKNTHAICDCQKRDIQKNHIGEKYNLLTIEDIDINKPTNVIVKCECGILKSVSFRPLLHGDVKSCGCLAKNKLKITVGESYNRFTIVEDIAPKKYGTSNYKQVRALCECGNIKDVIYKELRQGKTKSCGCINAEKRIDIEKNKKFGYWTILSEGAPYIGKNVKTRTANVQCVCGKKKNNVTLNSIVQGKSKSCGCRGIEKKKKLEEEVISTPVSNEEEKWSIAIGFEGYYISTKGNVFSGRGKGKYLNTKDKTTLDLRLNNQYRSLNISKTVYRTFIGDWEDKEYILLNIDDNIYNSNIDNLFLAKVTNSGGNWVSRMFGGINGSCSREGMKRIKTRTISKGDIIKQYLKQKGLSTFLNMEMDLTANNKLLAISIDRIDNNKDYEVGNFTLVTRFENMGRNENSFEDFKFFIERVKSHFDNTDTCV